MFNVYVFRYMLFLSACMLFVLVYGIVLMQDEKIF